MEQAVAKMLEQHRRCDGEDARDHDARVQRKLEALRTEATRIRHWLKDNPNDRRGARGAVVLSNRTDNDSAKLATGKRVIQGYTGVAVVDEKAQVVLEAQAHGTGSEQAKHKAKADPLYDQCARTVRVRLYRPEDFKLAADHSHCICPAGKRLYSNGKQCTIGGFAAMKFCGAQQDACPASSGHAAYANRIVRRYVRSRSSRAGVVPATRIG
jgi:hypothetical protein